ncbi:MAG: beta-lactamase family protein [Deferribacteres bacterium]|nr:beta-lactamase family protein [Deferribacteres bacterium]
MGISKWIFSIIFVSILAACATDTRDRYTTDRVDPLFRLYQGNNVPGAAVSIIHNGKVIVEKTYGMADLENKMPITSQSNFRLASFTKQFTAMCIMQLIEREKLELATTLPDIFPDFPNYGKSITVRHLLQHQSGLLDYEDLLPENNDEQVHDADVLQIMMHQSGTYFPAGTDYRYSNSGYAVLAMIIEKISGVSYADYLRENIFQPLGMLNSVAFQNGISTVSNRAYGYTVEGDSIYFSDQSRTSAVLGDGGIYSSIDDLYKWDQALYDESLISGEMLQQAFTPGLSNYGFGWRIDTYRGHLRTHHTGSTRGFRTVICRFPEDDFTVIILSNRNGPGVEGIADELTDIFLFE